MEASPHEQEVRNQTRKELELVLEERRHKHQRDFPGKPKEVARRLAKDRLKMEARFEEAVRLNVEKITKAYANITIDESILDDFSDL